MKVTLKDYIDIIRKGRYPQVFGRTSIVDENLNIVGACAVGQIETRWEELRTRPRKDAWYTKVEDEYLDSYIMRLNDVEMHTLRQIADILQLVLSDEQKELVVYDNPQDDRKWIE